MERVNYRIISSKCDISNIKFLVQTYIVYVCIVWERGIKKANADRKPAGTCMYI